jgi:protein pelota
LLTETKTARETKLLDQFHRLNAHTPDMVAFGWGQVQKAACAGAVKTLLLSDSLFRSKQVEERRKSADLIDEVRGNGGAVQIFLGGSNTEAELDKITGVAAILNFPLE